MDSMHSTVAIIVAEVGHAPAPFKLTVVGLLQRSGGADYTVYALLTFLKLAASETPSSGDSSVVKGSLAPLACPRTASDATLLTKRGRDGDAKEAEESTISKGGSEPGSKCSISRWLKGAHLQLGKLVYDIPRIASYYGVAKDDKCWPVILSTKPGDAALAVCPKHMLQGGVLTPLLC